MVLAQVGCVMVPTKGVAGVILFVRVTLLVLAVQLPLEIVHVSTTELPAVNPVIVEVAEEGDEITAPLVDPLIDHTPVP